MNDKQMGGRFMRDASPSWLVDGPPLSDDMQRLFGPYAGGRPAVSVMVKQEGLEVGYDDGSTYLFVAVPDGGALMARPDGKLEVRS